ncbi:MAG: helix-turn-helix domain-containing protein [Planctomycetota bacterium]|jgi:AraC family transcriptional regulator of arabinose operon|nr:helix-turn-helix domain-containing protein [Planctomycetota bacterium]
MLDPLAHTGNKARECAAKLCTSAPGAGTKRSRGRSDYLLLQSLEGNGRVASGSDRIILAPGELALFPPGTPQQYLADREDWTHCWVHFHPRDYWLSWLDWPRVGAIGHVRLADPALRAAVDHQRQRLLAAVDSHKPRRDALAMNALEALLLLVDDQVTRHHHHNADPRIHQALDWLQHRLDRAVSLSEVAAACELSPSRLSHLFKHELGLAPLRWHERERMRRAAQRLTASTDPIKDIAATMGYDDPLYFSTRFKYHHGCSPRAWRNGEVSR